VLQSLAMYSRYRRFRAEEIRSTDLRTSSAQRKHPGDASSIGNSSGRHHGHFDRINDLWNQCHCSGLRGT
jgi:hypothetical protein